MVLGTSVLTPTLRYNPAVVAQAFATLGCLAPGRVILGVGTGESLNEVVVGAEWPDQKERFRRLKESVLLIGQLFREDFVSFEGEFYTTHNATIYDKPDEPVPVYIAGSGPAASRLAGRIAEGYIATSGKVTELYTETLLPAVAEGLEKAGRPDDAIERMIEMKVSFDTDRGRAMEDTKIWAALALSGEQKMGVEDPREMERLATTVEDVAHRRWLVQRRCRRAHRADPPVPRVGLRPPGLPLPRRRPGAGHGALRRAGAAGAARALRLSRCGRRLDAGGDRPDAYSSGGTTPLRNMKQP